MWHYQIIKQTEKSLQMKESTEKYAKKYLKEEWI